VVYKLNFANLKQLSLLALGHPSKENYFIARKSGLKVKFINNERFTE